MRDARVRDIAVDSERTSRRDVIGPANRAHAAVQCLWIRRRELCQRQPDAVGDARPEDGAIRDLLRTAPRNAGAACLDMRRPEAAELVGEEPLHGLRGGRTVAVARA